MKLRKLLAATFACLAILAFAGAASASHHEKGEETANPCGDNPCEDNPCGDNPCEDNPCGDNPCGD
jgi:hypothetical protein